MLNNKPRRLTGDFNGVIYLSHAFGGKQENADEVAEIIRTLRKKLSDALFISPIHCFGFLYNDTEYQEGLDMTLWLLSKCDIMIAVGEISRGVQAEIDFCQRRKIPYIHTNNIDELMRKWEGSKVC